MGKNSRERKAREMEQKPYGATGETVGAVMEMIRREASPRYTGELLFRGYCVNVLATDEYLGRVVKGQDMDTLLWSPSPAKALLFPSYQAAMKHCIPDKGQIVKGYFETPSQFLTFDATNLNPATE